MVASQADVKKSPESIALAMSGQIESLADAGNWGEIQDLLIRLHGIVMDVPEAERRSVLQAIQRSADTVAAKANNARQDVTSKLTDLRRGQAATKAYTLR